VKSVVEFVSRNLENIFPLGLASAPAAPIISRTFWDKEVPQMIAPYQPPADHQLVNPGHARTVMGVLGLLIRTVGPCSSLGIVLSQARCEVGSLLQSEEAATRPQSRHAA